MYQDDNNLDQDILQCRQDILNARRRLHDKNNPETSGASPVPIVETIRPSIRVESTTVEPANTVKQRDLADSRPKAAAEPPKETAGKIPTFEEIIVRHAELQRRQSAETAPDESVEQVLTPESEQTEPEPVPDIQLHTDKPISDVVILGEDTQSEPVAQETAEAGPEASAAEMKDSDAAVSDEELADLESEWSDEDILETPQVASEEILSQDSETDFDSVEIDDEEDRILEELIARGQSESSFTMPYEKEPRFSDTEETARPEDAQLESVLEDQETNIPRFDLAEQILAEQRKAAASRRQAPQRTRNTSPYKAADTVGEIIDQARRNAIKSRVEQNPDTAPTPAGPVPPWRSHIAGGGWDMPTPLSRRILSEIVCRDIESFMKTHHEKQRSLGAR